MTKNKKASASKRYSLTQFMLAAMPLEENDVPVLLASSVASTQRAFAFKSCKLSKCFYEYEYEY